MTITLIITSIVGVVLGFVGFSAIWLIDPSHEGDAIDKGNAE